MQWLFPSAIAVLALLPQSFAQMIEPMTTPSDVSLELKLQADAHRFHLGELIPITYSYTAKTPGKYSWLAQWAKLAGGHSLTIECSPQVEPANALPAIAAGTTFDQMLNSCGGVGGGFGSGCGDCDGETPLTAEGLSFGPVPLNKYVRFLAPGVYSCQASAADITTSSPDEKFRSALLVKSDPIVLTVINDPQWAASAAAEYGDAYASQCRSDDIVQSHSLECFDIADRITFLDTSASLAIEVKEFDGRPRRWGSGFWDPIRTSSYPQEAVRLLTSRIQDPDFQASPEVLQWLASSELRIEQPDAFVTSVPATYHAQAVEKLREFVRALGSSLAKKNPDVRFESVKTFRMFTEQNYCEPQSLIPSEERNQMLLPPVP